MDDLSPEITKKYKVLEKMGEGGMGAVYKVQHRDLGTYHVIKLILASLQGQKGLRARFLREATTAVELRHPNIVQVTDYAVTSDGTPYIVMEFIKGVNLREALKRAHGPLDYRFVVNVGRQALAALGYMHRKQKVHCDISPENLVLTRDDDGNPHIKLIDLGISKSAEQQTLSNPNDLMGKASYMPPEQFGGKPDNRSDLYALGVVIYELLTDSKPIVGGNPLAIMTSHLRDLPRPFAASDPVGRVPEKLRAIVMKALEKDPSARWQTAQEFSSALGAYAASLAEKTIEVTIPTFLSEDAMSLEGEQQDWEEAREADSIEAWERYLGRNPNSPRAVRARLFLEALEEREEQDWQHASGVDTIEAWRKFIRDHADFPRVSKARRRLEKLEQVRAEERAWTEAASNDSVESWRRFLREHATSPRADSARAKARQAREHEEFARAREKEQNALAVALELNTEQSLGAFLKAFPSSQAGGNVRQRIATLEATRLEDVDWNAALAANTPTAWELFIACHPGSREALAREHLREATEADKRETENQAWIVATNDGTCHAYETFLRDHPAAESRAEAERRLDDLRGYEAMEAVWTSATTKDDLEGFVRRYPQSPHLLAAQQRLETIAAEEGERNAWADIRTKENLTTFMRNYPQSLHIAEASRRLQAIEVAEQRELSLNLAEQAWAKASSRKATERFLRDYPDSPWAAESKRRLEAFAAEDERRRQERAAADERARSTEVEAWRSADQADSKEEFAAFVRIFPKSSHAAEARLRLTAIEADDQQHRAKLADDRSWETAKASKAFEWFRRTYPRSSHAAEARLLTEEIDTQATMRRAQWLEGKAWATAKDAGTKGAIERFIQEHPNSQFDDDAHRSLDEIESRDARLHSLEEEAAAWKVASNTGTEAALRSFLRRYPQSVLVAKAQQQLRTIEEEDRAWQRATTLGTLDAIEEFARNYPQSHVAGVNQARDTLNTKEQRRSNFETGGVTRNGSPAAASVPDTSPALRLTQSRLAGRPMTNVQRNLGYGRIALGYSIIAFGVLLTGLGFAVVVRKGPQGWVEVFLGVVVLAIVRKRLPRRVLVWATAALVAATIIAYDLSQQPLPTPSQQPSRTSSQPSPTSNDTDATDSAGPAESTDSGGP